MSFIVIAVWILTHATLIFLALARSLSTISKNLLSLAADIIVLFVHTMTPENNLRKSNEMNDKY